jgi:uncharacterized protein (DUF2141 family)
MLPRIRLFAGTLMLAVTALGQKPLGYSPPIPVPALTGPAPNPAGVPPGAIADFNGDGKLDIIYAPGGVPTAPLQLLLGNGDGTFRQGTPPPVAAGAYSLAAGDFNSDGKPDLAVCFAATGEFQSAQMQILINQGNGTFRNGQLLPTCNAPLTVADFNGDGKLDIYAGGVSLWLGNGDGTFRGLKCAHRKRRTGNRVRWQRQFQHGDDGHRVGMATSRLADAPPNCVQ